MGVARRTAGTPVGWPLTTVVVESCVEVVTGVTVVVAGPTVDVGVTIVDEVGVTVVNGVTSDTTLLVTTAATCGYLADCTRPDGSRHRTTYIASLNNRVRRRSQHC